MQTYDYTANSFQGQPTAIVGAVAIALVATYVGMQLTMLVEHDSVPWEALPGAMERTADGEWRLADRPWRLAHTYTLRAVKHV